ncbi:EamA family transporter RarD [Cognatishimia sp. MH4019]|uniref:EamA family transporter RarD n=1 Tax=Cognatishimia sp. MH4019 TaxID=2854030 RepID=UPI001CD2D2DE|nr:EamA family transporter RarD [Cognatishimia sp. MH4019]
MSEAGKGVAAMIVACVVWGLSPLYYKLIAHVPPGEVLAHRTLWSLMFFACVLVLQGRLGALGEAVQRWRMVLLAALLVSVNWFVFIFSVQVGRTVEASLGYYIFPLVAVVLGIVIFRERLRLWQGLAVALASVAVVVLSVGVGAVPWISLVLAVTFGFYGVLKKRLDMGPVVSVTCEVLLLAPIALLWLGGLHLGLFDEGRPGAVFGSSLFDSGILMLSGVLTGGPLILFSYAARRVALASIGVIQYLNPSLQFFCAVVVFAEPFTRAHAIAFPLIWTALAIYSVAALRQERAARKAVSASAVV